MAVSRETVLFYEPEGETQGALLKSILVRMGVRIKNVPSEAVGQTIGCLLGRKGFTDKRLEILLREMKKSGVSVPYKAIVTETNLGWLFHQLYDELAAEHKAMQRGK